MLHKYFIIPVRSSISRAGSLTSTRPAAYCVFPEDSLAVNHCYRNSESTVALLLEAIDIFYYRQVSVILILADTEIYR